MKGLKKLLLGLTALCMAFGFACSKPSKDSSQNSESVETQSSEAISEESSQALPQESAESSAETSETDSVQESVTEASEELLESSAEEDLHEHELTVVGANEADCVNDGNIKYYICVPCGQYFADEEATELLTAEQVVVKASHKLVYQEELAPLGKTNGKQAYYDCSVCGKNYADEQAEKELLDEDLVIVAALNIPDFLVEVPAGREPVVLQLSDPQICNWGDLEKWCYSYIRETVQETKPDLIIMTGDVVYGRFDPDGTLLTSLIAFMETLKTPWAPVFGNHDNESLMGVDWQCDQLETAKYCLFKQGDLTGNGNYSVGLAQNDELLRVFYMMDSNGCGAPMCDSNGVQTKPAAGTNVVKTSAGFGKDQIDWYTDEITAIHEVDSDVKISFAYHIQQAIFGKAFAKYEEYNPSNVNGSILNNPLDLDKMETADETDFGYLGRTMKGPWDTNYTVFNGMKALGADSIFVGHEHCNSCSIVYEGVRFQFSQKSSMYDRYNSVTEDGTITGAYMEGHPADSHPLMGGTVIPVSSVDGSIGTGYIYYAGNPFYFEPKPVELPVNGLKLDSTMLQSGMGMTIHGTAFSETLNAYKIYSEGQGKLYFAPALAAEYNTFTFTALVPEDSANTTSVEFYLRVKDANGNNPLEESDGKYIYYGSSLIPRGQWKTFTVDITSVGEDCTEFSLMFAKLSTTWLRDVEFTNTEHEEETPIVVNGEKLTASDLQDKSRMTLESKAFDETTNAYYITSQFDSGKVYMDTATAAASNTFTFSVCLAEDTETTTFGLRVKPNGTPFSSEQGTLSEDGKYLWFHLKKGEWITVTVDISQVGADCTEFAFTTMNGLKVWVKDISFS